MAHDDDALQALWQEQPVGPPPTFTVAELTRRQARFKRVVQVRNALEYAAGVVVVGVFGYLAWVAPALPVRLGCAAIIAATVGVLVHLRRRGSPLPPPPADAPASVHLAHHRAALTRQRDLLRSVPRWYVGPLYAAMLALTIGIMTTRPDLPLATLLARTARPFAEMTLLCAFVVWANRRAARALQRKIDALGE